jgi:hypothetical protein
VSGALSPPARSDGLLRSALWLDALACSALGVLATAGAPALERALGTPAGLARPLGGLLLGAAALVATIASRPRLDARAVGGIIALNVAWALGSVVVALFGPPVLTGRGRRVIVAQAVATALLVGLEVLGLGRARVVRRPLAAY